MTQVVASKPLCLENSTELTRPASESFYRIDGSEGPTIIDKHQAKRLYRLQRTPIRETQVHLDKTDLHYDAHGYFEQTLQRQAREGSIEPIRSIYHPPTDMSNQSLKTFTLGKARIDPQRLIPRDAHSVRTHPTAITILRHEQKSEGEVVPKFKDRLVVDRVLRGRLGPGGTLNSDEDCRQAENYLRAHGRSSAPSTTINYVPRANSRTLDEELKRDALAQHFMYTSTQQAAYDEVTWDSKLPPKLPVPVSTYEADGSDPVLKTAHAPSLLDTRSRTILDYDTIQPRHPIFYRKPIENIAPLPRAQHISGYSGCIGGDHIQDIDNPAVDFKPFTILRTEQPKFGQNPYKPNIPFYTGKTHWTKMDAVSHLDNSGRPYTTTAAFHRPLPLEPKVSRHSDLNGQLSRAVTTVVPQNPFNQMPNSITTTNASLDSRPQFLIQQLPEKITAPEAEKK